MDSDKPPLLKIFLVISYLTLLLVCGIVFAVKTAPESSQTVETSFNKLFYKSNIPIAPDMKTLGVIIRNDILDCMVGLESSGNPDAYNPMDTDGREKFGLLQFGDIEFEEWCVGKYGYPDDIFNGSIQYICANRMIRDDQSWRWPSYFKCIDNEL